MIILQDMSPSLAPAAPLPQSDALHAAATHTSTLSLHSTSPVLGHSPLSRRRGRPIENPYANVGQQAPPSKPQRRKSPLLKQLPVEEQGQWHPEIKVDEILKGDYLSTFSHNFYYIGMCMMAY